MLQFYLLISVGEVFVVLDILSYRNCFDENMNLNVNLNNFTSELAALILVFWNFNSLYCFGSGSMLMMIFLEHSVYFVKMNFD
jgi:hypothetical protein